ncbi:MAG: helix-turn-helix transcriptional regulator [Chitinophagaceae bacterium]|nr:helix-turn-helix transcriptional regulator [Cytophagales bacterium]MCA6469835.1 helix-turn-helix transcriptional regulator [Chitinophagaceae bacterium]MCA6477794.1 helix-turn-helix transcriptional regulator [Chitinophagaceae bacterium]MCA6487989.1 helix-turn-helix transcriptional regulator [Chitinophagaceae bacterium]
MQLANRIRQIRQAYGFSQAEIAHKCEITPSAYGQIERKARNSTFKTLQKIATAIGVSLPFLGAFQIKNSSKKTSYNLLLDVFSFFYLYARKAKTFSFFSF